MGKRISIGAGNPTQPRKARKERKRGAVGGDHFGVSSSSLKGPNLVPAKFRAFRGCFRPASSGLAPRPSPCYNATMLLQSYDLDVSTMACDCHQSSLAAFAHLHQDIAAVLPYLNAVCPGAVYDSVGQVITWKQGEPRDRPAPHRARHQRRGRPGGRRAVRGRGRRADQRHLGAPRRDRAQHPKKRVRAGHAHHLPLASRHQLQGLRRADLLELRRQALGRAWPTWMPARPCSRTPMPGDEPPCATCWPAPTDSMAAARTCCGHGPPR